MKLPTFLGRVPRSILVFGVLAAALLVSVAASIRINSSGSDNGATTPPTPTLAISVANQQSTSTPSPSLLVAPTATPIINRTDCSAIRGSDYESAAERSWFLQNCLITESNVRASTGSSVIAPTTGSEGGLVRGSSDRLVIQRLGISAPVNYRTVEADGVLGNPVAAWDVVWYDFSSLPGLGGYPGGVGNAVYAGHVDYRTVGPAVFWNLKNIAEGDIIEIYANGGVYRYVVEWFADYTPGDNWNAIVATGTGEVVTLITCIGTFDYERREYSNRRVVRARIQ